MDTNPKHEKETDEKKTLPRKACELYRSHFAAQGDIQIRSYSRGYRRRSSGRLVVSLFRYILAEAETVRTILIEASGQKLLMALFSVGLLICMLIGAAFITGREPVSGGSGIPQVEAELKGKLNPRWARTAFAKFFGGLMAIGGGTFSWQRGTERTARSHDGKRLFPHEQAA